MTDLPAPGAEDSVLIRVSYAGVNPVDWQLVDQLTPNSPFPFVLGVDVAGLVEHVPAQETRLHVGDPVFGMARTHGSRRVHRGADGRADRAAGAHSRQRFRRSGRRPSGGGDSRAGFAGTPRPRPRPAPSGDGGSRRSRRLRGSDGFWLAERVSSRPCAETSPQRSAPTGCRGRLRRRRRRRCSHALRESHPDGVDAVLDIVNGPAGIKRDAEILKRGGRLVSTTFTADVDWFAECKISAYNIVGHTTPFGGTPNPRQSSHGLDEIARMLAAGTITSRIRTTVQLGDAPTRSRSPVNRPR